VGVGDPLEAAITLDGPLRAGTWHFVGDGLILADVEMTFDVIWRGAGGDTVIVSFAHHFTQVSASSAEKFEADAAGIAAAARSGDELVLRMTATKSTTTHTAYIPNADGSLTHGRIPSLTLP
jgi:hypothetical protein